MRRLLVMAKPSQRARARQILHAYWRAMRLTYEASPGLFIVVLITTVLTGLAAPLQAWIAKLMIDSVTAALASGEVMPWQTLLPPILAFVGIWGVSQVAESLAQSVRNLLGEYTMYHANLRVIQKATAMDPACFDDAKFYDQLNVANRQVWRIANVTYELSDVTVQAIALVSLLGLLATIHWLVPFVVIGMTMPKLIAKSRFTRQRAAVWMNYTGNRRMIDYMSAILSEREHVKETRLFRLEPHLLGKMRVAVRAFLQDNRRIDLASERWNAALSLLPLIGTAGIWLYVAAGVLARRLTVGDLALTFQALESSRRALDGIAYHSAFLVENTFFVVELFNYLDRPASDFAGALRRPAPGSAPPKPNLRGAIVFDNVSFRYLASRLTKNVTERVSATHG
jgi:ABC-type multidrug transport system fused ATPase/permease subunit